MLYLEEVAGFKTSILSKPESKKPESKSTSSPLECYNGNVNKSSDFNKPVECNHGKPTTNSGNSYKPVECNSGNLDKPPTNNGNSTQPITNNDYYYNQPPDNEDQESCCEEGCCIF